MFTGLIEEVGTVKAIKPIGKGKRFKIEADRIFDDLKIDDSVSINGACQTVVSIENKTFSVEAIEETLRKSTLGSFTLGKKVNLERAMALGDRLGGHLVQGHVDCRGTVETIIPESAGIQLWIKFPEEFKEYIIPVGSICINGVSLTAARVEGSRFMVSIIPHTWKVTTLSSLSSRIEVNLEFDLIGKYIKKMTCPETKLKRSGLDKYIDQPEY